MIASAACDIQAVRTRDPAVDKYSRRCCHERLHALPFPHWSLVGIRSPRALAIFLQNQVFGLVPGGYSPGSENWPRDYARPCHRYCGGETAVIEDDVSILQSVTTGGTGENKRRSSSKIREERDDWRGCENSGNNIEVGRGAKWRRFHRFTACPRALPPQAFRRAYCRQPGNDKRMRWIWTSISTGYTIRLSMAAASELRGTASKTLFRWCNPGTAGRRVAMWTIRLRMTISVMRSSGPTINRYEIGPISPIEPTYKMRSNDWYWQESRR